MLLLLAACRQDEHVPAPAPVASEVTLPSATPAPADAASPPASAEPTARTYRPVIRSATEVAAHVGEIVTLEGVVDRGKMPRLLGADVNDIDTKGHDSRGERCRVTGLLVKTVVTPDEIARGPLAARRGPGTYYAVVGADGFAAGPIPLDP